jgi:hypothetical protein
VNFVPASVAVNVTAIADGNILHGRKPVFYLALQGCDAVG